MGLVTFRDVLFPDRAVNLCILRNDDGQLTSSPRYIRQSFLYGPLQHTTAAASSENGRDLPQYLSISILIRQTRESGRTVLHGIVLGQVLQVAGLHARKVFYLGLFSFFQSIYTQLSLPGPGGYSWQGEGER